MNSHPDTIMMIHGIDVDADKTQYLQDMATHNYVAHSISNSDTYTTGGYSAVSWYNLEENLSKFYMHPAFSSNVGQVKISQPYVDSMGLGLVLTLSKAVYDEDNNLQGVVGYDVPVNMVLKSLDQDFDDSMYPYIVDFNDGRVLYHPKVPLPVKNFNPDEYGVPDRKVSDPIFIENLEFYPNGPAFNISEKELSLVEQINSDCTTLHQILVLLIKKLGKFTKYKKEKMD